jgi:hypothetical protein
VKNDLKKNLLRWVTSMKKKQSVPNLNFLGTIVVPQTQSNVQISMSIGQTMWIQRGFKN